MILIKLGVNALVFNQADQLLMVARKNDHSNFGLPGGKVEEGESLIDALKRELKEETGYDCEDYFTPIMIFGDTIGDRHTTTFLCKVKGTMSTPEELVARAEAPCKWGSWEIIESGKFATYNKNLHYYYSKLQTDARAVK